MDVSTAFAVVYAEDGSRHTVCWTAEEALAEINELEYLRLRAAAVTPATAAALTSVSVGTEAATSA